MVSSASSQEMRSKRPSPLAPTRLSGCSRRSGALVCSRYPLTFAHSAPAVNGCSRLPLRFTARPSSSTVTTQLHPSGQSSGQAPRTSCMPPAYFPGRAADRARKYAAAMRIIVLGAGHVGRAIVGALYQEHEITVVDTDADRLQVLADRYDVRTVEGNGTTKRVIAEAGIQDCSLFIASTSREEANLVSAMLVKRLSRAMVVVRTTSVEYLDAWREREIDVDFMVSSELETANAISGLIGIPAARQTDVFADGQVQIVEFDVPANASVVGTPLRRAPLPKDSKVVSIIRGDEMRHPSGAETIEADDRIVVIASPDSAREWSRVMSDEQERVDDI